jgi:hypothetical protein
MMKVMKVVRMSNFDLENNSALNYGLFRYNLFYYPVCVCGFKCANLFTAFLFKCSCFIFAHFTFCIVVYL